MCTKFVAYSVEDRGFYAGLKAMTTDAGASVIRVKLTHDPAKAIMGVSPMDISARIDSAMVAADLPVQPGDFVLMSFEQHYDEPVLEEVGDDL